MTVCRLHLCGSCEAFVFLKYFFGKATALEASSFWFKNSSSPDIRTLDELEARRDFDGTFPTHALEPTFGFCFLFPADEKIQRSSLQAVVRFFEVKTSFGAVLTSYGAIYIFLWGDGPLFGIEDSDLSLVLVR